MGRFLTPDPSFENIDLETPQSWNLYAYVNGDPVNANDPSGLFKSYCQEHPLSPQCPGGMTTKDDVRRRTGMVALEPPGDDGPGPGGSGGRPKGPCPLATTSFYTYECIHDDGADWNLFKK